MESELVAAIADAARGAVRALFQEHPEQFYYLALVTTGEGLPPVLTAWSVEALQRAVAEDSDPARARQELKWSYADSPYFDFGSDQFDRVRELFLARAVLDAETTDDEWDREMKVRLGAMEKALSLLDAEGLFGVGADRMRIVVNAEVMPPDPGNVLRARRLNPADALQEWLEEAAELEP